jgi:cytochrome b561
MEAESQRWGRGLRRLHWWTAGFVFVVFPLGWIMVALPLRELLLKFLLYQLHKTIGLTVLGLTLYRLSIRARVRRPDWDAELPEWQRRAAWSMHAMLHVLLLAVPLLGYLTAALAPARVPTLFLGLIPIPHLLSPDAQWFAIIRRTHRWAAVLLATAAAAHAGAALEHHRRGRSVLKRMWGSNTVLSVRASFISVASDIGLRHRPEPRKSRGSARR